MERLHAARADGPLSRGLFARWRGAGPVVLAALLGCLASVAVVVAAGRSLLPVGMVLPDAFGGLLSPVASGGGTSAAVVIVGVAVLVSCWWWLLAEASAGRLTVAGTALIVGGWAAPMLVGPPLLSFDAYAYLAQGELAARGMDPYAAGPVALGADAAVGWVDPTWRSSPAPYGPVAIVALRAVTVLAGGLTQSVLTLRLLAVLGVAAAAGLAVLLSSPHRRPFVLALTLANPVTLLHLVGGAHLDALLAGLVALTLLALHAGRSWSALLLGGVAVACKVTVLPVFLLIAVVLFRRRGRAVAWFAPVALLLPFLITGLVLDRPWGFLGALSVPGAAAPWYAPSSLVGLVLRGAAALLGMSVQPSLANHIGSAVALAAGSVVVLGVLRAAWREPAAPPQTTIARAGVILLTVALSLPSLYGWYLGPALFVVAATGARRYRHLLVVVSSLLAFTSLPSLYDAPRWLIATAWAVTLGLLGGRLLRHRPPRASAGAWQGADPVAARVTGDGRRAAWVRRESEPRTAHRRLPVVTRLAELIVIPALLLAVAAAPAQAVASPARRAAIDADVQAVALATQVVSAAYPDHQIARVLPRPGSAGFGAQDFDVQLVVPGKRSCWLQVRLPLLGLPEWLDSGRPAGSAGAGRCPEPGLNGEPSPDRVPRVLGRRAE